MTVWIDPPAWPFRGQMFSHLVSDTSLEELHDLAERAGAHPRAFDRDHYDIPERLYQACVEAGAVEAPTRQLVHALRSSGLRRTKAVARAETERRREELMDRWPLARSALAVDLLDRWGSRWRRYHDLRHLAHCLDSLAQIGGGDRPVTLALWFHDAVYEGRAGTDEEESAQFAETALDGLVPRAEVGETARLVRLTAGHQPSPGDLRGGQMCDADLAILGADPDRYRVYLRDVRVEYGDVRLADFRRGRRQVVRHLLSLDPLYRTPVGVQLWQASAVANLTAEADRLDSLTGPDRPVASS